MTQIIWEQCRRQDGSLDLRKAARHTNLYVSEGMDSYLSLVEQLKPVTSRQIGALAIATAHALFAAREPE